MILFQLFFVAVLSRLTYATAVQRFSSSSGQITLPSINAQTLSYVDAPGGYAHLPGIHLK